jgi:hypothetical protein
MATRTETFGPGEKNCVVQVRLGGQAGEPFPQGRYVAGSWLATVGPRAFSASVGFEIKYVY